MITTNIDQAIEALIKGDVIAMPTETVYGLAGNAFDEAAIKKIFTLKNRPFYNPLIVHIRSAEYLNTIADDIPEIAFEMAKYFWPGPLTLILKKQKHMVVKNKTNRRAKPSFLISERVIKKTKAIKSSVSVLWISSA